MSTTQTEQERLGLQPRQIVSNTDLDLIRTNGEAVHRARIAAEFPVPGTLGTTKGAITESLDGTTYYLDVTAPTVIDGIASGEIVHIDATTSEAGVFTDLPYRRQGGTTYYIGAKHVEVPNRNAQALGGQAFSFARWQKIVGFGATADSVSDATPGSLIFTLTSLQGGVWPNEGYTRRVTIWKTNPATSGAASRWTGDITSNGSALVATVPHLFGQHQSAVSATAADYAVMVHGLTVTSTNITATEDDDGNLMYWILGTILNGTFSDTLQTLLSRPGTNALDLNQLAADLYDSPTLDGDGAANLALPVQGLVRMEQLRAHRIAKHIGGGPGVFLGTLAASRTWWTGYSKSTPTGKQRFTWPSFPSGAFFVTAEATNARLWVVGSLTPLYAELDNASATGDYLVFAVASESATGVGSEAMIASLTVVPIAELASHTNQVQILSFHWDGATISAEAQNDVIRTYRPWNGRTADMVAKDSTGNVLALSIADNTSLPEVRLRFFDASDAVDPAADPTGVAMVFTRPDANTRKLGLPGPQGEGVALSAGEAVELLPGGPTDLHQRHETGVILWRKASTAVNKGYLSILGGAQSAADADGHKPAWYGGDFKLITEATDYREVHLAQSNGLGDGLSAVGGASGRFGYGDSGLPHWTYEGAESGVVLVLEPPHQRGRTILGFRVTAWITTSGSDSDKLVGAIVRSASSDATGTLTGLTLNPTPIEWLGATHTTPSAQDLLLATPAAPTSTTTYRVKLQTVNVSAGSIVFHVSKVEAIYRVGGLLPA